MSSLLNINSLLQIAFVWSNYRWRRKVAKKSSSWWFLVEFEMFLVRQSGCYWPFIYIFISSGVIYNVHSSVKLVWNVVLLLNLPCILYIHQNEHWNTNFSLIIHMNWFNWVNGIRNNFFFNFLNKKYWNKVRILDNSVRNQISVPVSGG